MAGKRASSREDRQLAEEAVRDPGVLESLGRSLQDLEAGRGRVKTFDAKKALAEVKQRVFSVDMGIANQKGASRRLTPQELKDRQEETARLYSVLKNHVESLKAKDPHVVLQPMQKNSFSGSFIVEATTDLKKDLKVLPEVKSVTEIKEAPRYIQ
jgi:hypothetical protein